MRAPKGIVHIHICMCKCRYICVCLATRAISRQSAINATMYVHVHVSAKALPEFIFFLATLVQQPQSQRWPSHWAMLLIPKHEWALNFLQIAIHIHKQVFVWVAHLYTATCIGDGLVEPVFYAFLRRAALCCVVQLPAGLFSFVCIFIFILVSSMVVVVYTRHSCCCCCCNLFCCGHCIAHCCLADC